MNSTAKIKYKKNLDPNSAKALNDQNSNIKNEEMVRKQHN